MAKARDVVSQDLKTRICLLCGCPMVMTGLKILDALWGLEGPPLPDRLFGPLFLHHPEPWVWPDPLGVSCPLGSASSLMALTDLGTSSPTANPLGPFTAAVAMH